MKPQRPHVHRFRFERPEGYVSRGHCVGCGAFRAAWADGMGPDGLTKRPRREVTPVSVLRKRNVEAWALTPGPSPARGAPILRWPPEGSHTRRAAELLRAAGGEWVSTSWLAEAVYGADSVLKRKNAASLMYQARVTFALPIEPDRPGPGSRGFRWRG